MYQEAAQCTQTAQSGFKGKDGGARPAKRQCSQEEVAGFLLGLGFGLVIGLLFHPQSSARTGVRIQQSAKQAATSRKGSMVA